MSNIGLILAGKSKTLQCIHKSKSDIEKCLLSIVPLCACQFDTGGSFCLSQRTCRAHRRLVARRLAPMTCPRVKPYSPYPCAFLGGLRHLALRRDKDAGLTRAVVAQKRNKYGIKRQGSPTPGMPGSAYISRYIAGDPANQGVIAAACAP
jgi:hypothetical protein